MGVSLFWAHMRQDLGICHQAEKETGKCIVQCSSWWEGGLLVDEVDTERGIDRGAIQIPEIQQQSPL